MANKENLNLLGFIATVMTENNLDLNTMDDVVTLVNEIALEKYMETTNDEKKDGAYAFSRNEVEKVVINSPTLLKERAKKKKEKNEDVEIVTVAPKQEKPKATPTEKKTDKTVFRIGKDKLAEYQAKTEQGSLFE